MHRLTHLFDNNRAWSERIRRDDPDFFTTLSRQQRPRYLNGGRNYNGPKVAKFLVG